MKKFIKQLAVVLILITLGLSIQITIASAAGPGTNPSGSSYSGPLSIIQKIGEKTNLPSFTTTGQHPDAPPDYGQQGIGAATSPIFFAIDLFRYMMSGIAIIIIVIQAIKLIATANEEEAGKAKMTLLIGIIGLLVIQLADVIVVKMFFGEQGQAFEDITTTKGYAEESNKVIRSIIGFVEVFLAAGSVLVLVTRGFYLITSAGNEEEMTKTKNHILYSLVGLGIVLLSEVIVRGVIFPAAGEELPDINKGKFILVEITNYIAGFVSIIAFLALFYGGYRYVVSGGGEEINEKLKKIIFGAVIALVLALGSFALVNTLLKFEPEGTTQTSEQGKQTEQSPPQENN